MWLTTFFVAVVASLGPLVRPINFDAGWLLYVGGELLKGGIMYRSYVDVNPPLAFLLSTIPNFVADWIGFRPVVAFKVMLVATVVASAAITFLILGRDRAVRQTLPFVGLVLLLLLFPLRDFGQREHWALLLVLPYLALRALRTWSDERSRALATVLGLFAGIGFSLKPFFLPAFLLIEFGVVAATAFNWRRVLDREVLISAGVQVIYWVIVVPLFFASYFDVLSRARQVYWAFEGSWTSVLLSGETVFIVLVLLAHSAFNRKGNAHRAAWVLCWGSVGFLVSAILQRKGWAYQFLPGLTLAAASAAGLVVQLVRHRGRLAVSFAIFLVACSGLLAVRNARKGFMATPDALPGLLDRIAAGSPVLIVGVTNPPTFPAMNYTSASWPYRYSCMWFLPAFYTGYERRDENGLMYPPSSAMGEVERAYLKEYADDILATPPKAILFDTENALEYMPPGTFDFEAYLSADRRLAAMFRDYILAGDTLRYRVFIRRDVQVQQGGTTPALQFGSRRVDSP